MGFCPMCLGSRFSPACVACAPGGTVGQVVWDRHKIDASRLLEMLDNRSIVIPNRNGRSASHLLIGTDIPGT